MFNLAWLLLALPAAGALINLLFGHQLNKRLIGTIGAGVVGAAFVVALLQWAALLGLPAEERSVTMHLWDWLTIGGFHVSAALLLDPLSVTMSLVVTGVGFLIHVYSISYMEHEERFQRFFIYLNFFIFAMLILVLSDNFLGMFVGWEGVGLASFLLIGFWFEQKDEMYGYYADCGKKAFLVNRVGDFGMIIAMMAAWTAFGTLTFQDFTPAYLEQFSEAAAEHATTFWSSPTVILNLICLALLLGAAGKSAQIPLYVWLPDAMAGPTPVSALIHAATMVTSGIYMIARTHVLWQHAALASEVAAWIGVLTALLAATIALVQTDLKKILAYSTVSQLGYMILGVGVGAYGASVFHLVTHAFFKALLFLAAGSVMHGLHGELDIRKMGGLKDKMPTTFRTFLVGSAALAGLPLMSGFFSKDAILAGALEHNAALYVIGLLTALLTAFYSFRSVFLPFYGKARDHHLYDHAHESPALMTIPLTILAALAILGGLLNLPFVETLQHWLEPAIGAGHETANVYDPNKLTFELIALTLSTIIGVFGFLLARARYLKNEKWAVNLTQKFSGLQSLAEHKWYVDELYVATIVAPLQGLADWFAKVFDRGVIDWIVNGVGQFFMTVAEPVRKLQSGVVPTYALTFLIGVAVVVAMFIFRV